MAEVTETPYDPLAGLATIDWANLEHAYGSARDVPQRLIMLRDGNAADQQAAIGELWGNIWHQGTVYSATAPAVPFLTRLVSYDRLPHERQNELLYLLAEIANGQSYLAVHDPENESRAAERATEQSWVEAARLAVSAEAPALLEQWASANAQRRRLLVVVLAALDHPETEAYLGQLTESERSILSAVLYGADPSDEELDRYYELIEGGLNG